MVRRQGVWVLAVLVAGAATRIDAAELQRATSDAWQEYVKRTGMRMQARLESGSPYLWMNETTERSQRVRRGEVLVAPLVGHGTEAVPGGLIHDWIGALFIPNASIADVLDVIHDYDRYKEVYKPVVTDSRLLAVGLAEQEFSMVWQRRVLFVNAALRGRYHARDVIVDRNRGYSIVEAASLQQVEDYGRPGEHDLPQDAGDGLIWRIHAISRYEERDGGVYLEIEVVALSRDIPSSLRWLVSPVVNHISVNSLTTTLQQTREAVKTRRIARERLLTMERDGLK